MAAETSKKQDEKPWEAMAKKYGCRYFARAAREEELGPADPVLVEALLAGGDKEAAAMVRQNPNLAFSRARQSEMKMSKRKLSAPDPAVVFATQCGCYRTAKAMILAGADVGLATLGGHTVLIAACLGAGVESSCRFIKEREKPRLLRERLAFLEWLWAREKDLGLYSEGFAARLVSSRLSHEHCRQAFVRCVESGSMTKGLAERSARALLQACGRFPGVLLLRWMKESCLQDLARRQGDFTGVFSAPLRMVFRRANSTVSPARSGGVGPPSQLAQCGVFDGAVGRRGA